MLTDCTTKTIFFQMSFLQALKYNRTCYRLTKDNLNTYNANLAKISEANLVLVDPPGDGRCLIWCFCTSKYGWVEGSRFCRCRPGCIAFRLLPDLYDGLETRRRVVDSTVELAVVIGGEELTRDPSQDPAVADMRAKIISKYDLPEQLRNQLTSSEQLQLCMQHLEEFRRDARCWPCDWDISLMARSLGFKNFKCDSITTRLDWNGYQHDPSVPHLLNVPADHAKWRPLQESELGPDGALDLNHFVLLWPDPQRVQQPPPQQQQQQQPQQARVAEMGVRAASTSAGAKRHSSQMTSSSSCSHGSAGGPRAAKRGR